VFIFGVCWCLVSVWHILLLRTGRKFDSGIFVLNIYFCVPYVFVLILILSSFNNFPFISCFSNSGWAVGPSGGIVEPDLVTRMRLDESADGHLSYGPSLSLFREPFANERYLFGDSQYHNCRPYLDMEKEFFSNNAAIVREVYFDTDILLGADSDEDVGVEEAVNAEDLVPVLSAEEIEWQHAAANDIMNMVIVRVTPVNSDSEDEETMEQVASPVVVEAVRDVTDSDEATGSADSVVNNSPDLVIAGGGEEGLSARMLPWTISCLGLRVVPLCSLLSLTGDEVSLYFLFSYPAL